jgi:predicted nucleic acid-binding protein
MAERQYLDANVLVRLLTADKEDDARAVRDHLKSATRPVAVITPVTMNEVVFVLRGALYGWGRESLVKAVQAMLDLPAVIEDRDVMDMAADFFENVHNNWADCVVAAYALSRAEGRLLSFDRGIDRIPGLRREEPARTNEAGL